VGSLAARRVHAINWACVWQAVVVHLFPAGAVRRDQACTPRSLAAGIDVVGAQGDMPGDCGSAVDPLYGIVPWPVAIDGEP